MPEKPPLRVLIADDEPLSCQRLIDLLAEQPDVEIVAIAEDGDQAISAIRRCRPDLVFLDIQMPNRTGLDVLREIGPSEMPSTILVTAYDQFALQAFQLAAVDYLLKPYSDERFEEAFRRARRRVGLEALESLREQLLRVLEVGENGAVSQGAPPSSRHLERIAVQMRGRTRIVPVAEIDYITASGVYVELNVGQERYLLRESLQSLEEQLDPQQFYRIHRSEIVRLDRVEMLIRGGGGEYQVKLRNGATLRVGRSRREGLEQRLGRA